MAWLVIRPTQLPAIFGRIARTHTINVLEDPARTSAPIEDANVC